MNCFGCAGLRKQQHQIFNKQYSKEEYQEKIRAMNLHTHSGIETARKLFNEFVLTIPHLYSWVKNCQNCTGNNLKNSKNALFCFDSMDLEDCRYSSWIFGCKDSYDCYGMGESQVVYDCVGVEEVQQVAFSFGTSNSSECYYTDLCFNCNHLFGCVGLRNKEYCVFNKQYSKDEYNELVPRIIEHMQKTGEWGEFFSPKISVFAYNESKAQEHYPLTKEEALKQGYKWKDDVDQIPKVEKVIPAGKLPDEIKDIPDDVLNWAIQCEVSGRPFIITKKELKIYRDKNFPMPHLHPEERQKRRMAVRPPQKLWKRECSKTGKEVWSPYSTEDSTIILCEEAYQEMMY